MLTLCMLGNSYAFVVIVYINLFKTFLHEDNQSVKWLDPDQDQSSVCPDLAWSKLFAKVISCVR